MKLSLNFKNTTAILAKLKSSLSIALWIFLIIITVFTGLVVFKEFQKISQVQTDTSSILDKIVRVNLPLHQTLEKKLGENSSFQSAPIEGANAFGIAPVKKSQ